MPFFASFLLFFYGRRCFPSFHRFIAHIYCFSLSAIPYGRKKRHRFCTNFFGVQNWLFKSRIPPLVFASFRHFQDLYSDPKGHLLFKSCFPPSFSKPICIPPYLKVSPSRSRQGIFIPYPALNISHPASRQTYAGPSCLSLIFTREANSTARGNLKRRGYSL